MTTAGTRLGSVLVLALIAPAVAAQTSANQNVSTQTAVHSKGTTQHRDAQPSGQASDKQVTSSMAAQQAASLNDQQPVVAPAPLVVMREAAMISIPVDATSSVPGAEGSASASEVVIPLPKMEGIVSVPVRPRKYEERPATASSAAVSIGSGFGYRRDPFTRRAKFHSGVDIKAKWGDPVGASYPGTIQFAGWYHGYGNLVIVDHGGGVSTYYAHLSSFELEVGAKVVRGTVVGYAGSTGRATSPHLHYEVRIDGNAINPFQRVALDPSSAYFKHSRPSMESSRPAQAAPAKTQDPID